MRQEVMFPLSYLNPRFKGFTSFNEVCFSFFFVSSETKRYYFGFDVNYLHSGSYYPMKRALVTIMSTRFKHGVLIQTIS